MTFTLSHEDLRNVQRAERGKENAPLVMAPDGLMRGWIFWVEAPPVTAQLQFRIVASCLEAREVRDLFSYEIWFMGSRVYGSRGRGFIISVNHACIQANQIRKKIQNQKHNNKSIECSTRTVLQYNTIRYSLQLYPRRLVGFTVLRLLRFPTI